MLLSGRREACECPHKICLNSHSRSLLRQMQPLWGRICNGEFKKWNWTKCVRIAIWSLREWKGRRDARRRAALAGRVKHKFWAIKKDHFFFFFLPLQTMLFRPTLFSSFSHIPQTMKWDVSLTLDAYAGTRAGYPAEQQPELLTMIVCATRASMSIKWGRMNAAFAGISPSKIGISCPLIIKELLVRAWVFLTSLLPLTYIFFFNYQ